MQKQTFRKKNNHFYYNYRQLAIKMISSPFQVKVVWLFFLSLLVYGGQSVTAVDLYQPYSVQQFTCMKDKNISYAIFRALRSNGLLDSNATKNIERANQAGLNTDIYIFVCRKRNATDQVKKVIQNLKNITELYSTIWIDVQIISNPNCGWNFADKSTNCEFLKEIINAIEKQGKKVGIYTSIHNWIHLFGEPEACPEAASKPLWYAHYKESLKVRATFLDFKQFGGWKYPTMKQYAQNQIICNANVNISFKQ